MDAVKKDVEETRVTMKDAENRAWGNIWNGEFQRVKLNDKKYMNKCSFIRLPENMSNDMLAGVW